MRLFPPLLLAFPGVSPASAAPMPHRRPKAAAEMAVSDSDSDLTTDLADAPSLSSLLNLTRIAGVSLSVIKDEPWFVLPSMLNDWFPGYF
ncbi:hypothetical protein J5N97_011175 [Dioscorea zingiberensis]|uniref:Secreted protein n=1 Tax=Dioscorea zingiberensis TaxID=325984 RepID=A0A9D5HN36_9LILI|nr:hypothetical protein J5N97_011175 [Dioscorea zingiberensis]